MKDALAIIICVGGGTSLIRHPGNARGWNIESVVWLRLPTDEERAAIIPSVAINRGTEMQAMKSTELWKA